MAHRTIAVRFQMRPASLRPSQQGLPHFESSLSQDPYFQGLDDATNGPVTETVQMRRLCGGSGV